MEGQHKIASHVSTEQTRVALLKNIKQKKIIYRQRQQLREECFNGGCHINGDELRRLQHFIEQYEFMILTNFNACSLVKNDETS